MVDFKAVQEQWVLCGSCYLGVVKLSMTHC